MLSSQVKFSADRQTDGRTDRQTDLSMQRHKSQACNRPYFSLSPTHIKKIVLHFQKEKVNKRTMMVLYRSPEY